MFVYFSFAGEFWFVEFFGLVLPNVIGYHWPVLREKDLERKENWRMKKTSTEQMKLNEYVKRMCSVQIGWLPENNVQDHHHQLDSPHQADIVGAHE